MRVLGIETSCDETAAAVVDGERRVLSNVALSQIEAHRPYGGVVPEIAARSHIEHLDGLIAEAMREAGLAFGDLDGVAALGAALDLSIGPMNASTNLAASTGADVWFIAYKSHWPLLGAGRLLWYPQTRAFSPENWGDWKSTMGDIASALKQRLSKEKAA